VQASGREAPTLPAAVQWLVLLLPTAFLAIAAWRHRWITEDGFIYLRIAEQLSAGNGPVFNAGERIEAYTGPAWVGVLALADVLSPVRAEWLAVWIGLLASAGGVLLATLGARRLWSPVGDGAVLVPLGALVFVVLYPTWGWATSGLETGLGFLWLGACTAILARWATEPSPRLGAWRLVVLGAGWVVRPEMMLPSLAFLAIVALGHRHPRQQLRVLAVGLALPVAYQLFRMAYFGSLVANTAIAKEGSRPNVDRGWRYFLDFADPYWLWVPVAAVVVAAVPVVRASWSPGNRRPTAVVAALVGSGVVLAAYVVVVGGDYHHARMFLPALFACCAPVAAVPVRRLAPIVAGGVVLVWAAVATVELRPEQLTSGNPFANGFVAQTSFNIGRVTTDDFGWAPDDPDMDWYTGEGYFHQAGFGMPIADPEAPIDPGAPDPLASFWGVGLIAYAPGIELHVFDQLGLADWLPSHLETEPADDRFPGHEKPLPSPWVAARLTEAGSSPLPEQFPGVDRPLIPATTGDEYLEQVAWARATLQCGALVDLREAATSELSVGNVMDNLLGSFHNTFVRVPPDPEEAYRQLCGDDVPTEVEAVREAAGQG
jgi:arabinofuranosyltransferase